MTAPGAATPSTPDTPGTPNPLPAASEQLPPHLRLMGIAAGKWIAQPVYVLAKLNVADRLAAGEASTAELAGQLDVRSDPLRRCLRAAASVGVFRETRPDHWALTDVAECLRTDAPMSLRDFTVLLGEEPMWAPFGGIMRALRQDGPVFDEVHGHSMYAHLAQDEELARTYQGAWAPLTRGVMRALSAAYDLSGFGTVADLGGGDGTALRTLLAEHPGMQGVLMDLPHVREAYRDTEGEAGARLRTVAGRLPVDVPADADAYLLKNTLHCLPPDLVRQTLKRVREEMARPDQRLLIVEAVLGTGGGFDWSKLVDIEVMVNNGGREHTLEEWKSLLAETGFRLVSAREVLHPQWLLEAQAA
ncbi:methyltransferase [Streptomyces nojiriensis]|uniref:methyltransferase n=1 Tax=Streptomyces nojiriensis TaxID=66374 RepID=UPI0036DF59E4